MDLRAETFEAFKRFKEQFDKWVAGLIPQEQELIHRFGERLIIEKIKTQPLPIVERETDKLPVVRPTVIGSMKISQPELASGMFVLGGTGTGKTKGILVPLVLQAIERNEGCLFLDPHGTGIDDVLS